MKIFSRGNEPAKPAAPAAPQLAIPGQPKPAAPAPATPAAPSAAPTPASAPAPAAPGAATPAAAGPANPDLSAIIEANVKEMSEKIARLASTIEGEHNERSEFESKLDKMEERMRKLSSLTEMISAQYNPFVGAAPSERDAPPAPEVGLAMPPIAAPLPPVAAQPPVAAAAAVPPSAFAGIPHLVPEPPAASAPMQLALEDPFASVAPVLEPPMVEAPPISAPPEPAPGPAPFTLEPMAPAPVAAAPAARYVDEDQPNGVRLWDVKTTFGSSLVMLNWADMLLKNAPSRECVAQLLDYYTNVGWLGEPARDRILAYVDGIAHAGPMSDDAADWRASVETHEKSLLFIEKLRALGARGE